MCEPSGATVFAHINCTPARSVLEYCMCSSNVVEDVVKECVCVYFTTDQIVIAFVLWLQLQLAVMVY